MVPIWTMYPYRDGLEAQGTPTRTVIGPLATHEFLRAAPGEILAWFRRGTPVRPEPSDLLCWCAVMRASKDRTIRLGTDAT